MCIFRAHGVSFEMSWTNSSMFLMRCFSELKGRTVVRSSWSGWLLFVEHWWALWTLEAVKALILVICFEEKKPWIRETEVNYCGRQKEDFNIKSEWIAKCTEKIYLVDRHLDVSKFYMVAELLAWRLKQQIQGEWATWKRVWEGCVFVHFVCKKGDGWVLTSQHHGRRCQCGSTSKTTVWLFQCLWNRWWGHQCLRSECLRRRSICLWLAKKLWDECFRRSRCNCKANQSKWRTWTSAWSGCTWNESSARRSEGPWGIGART